LIFGLKDSIQTLPRLAIKLVIFNAARDAFENNGFFAVGQMPDYPDTWCLTNNAGRVPFAPSQNPRISTVSRPPAFDSRGFSSQGWLWE
jgi:hypothetical protein